MVAARRVKCALLFLSVTVFGPTADALANPLDTFGAGARGGGMGSALTAAASGPEACYYNPAGLADLRSLKFEVGFLSYRPFLYASGRGASENSLHTLVELGGAARIPLGAGRLERLLYAGVFLALPLGPIYSIHARPEAAVHFPLLENRNRRLVAIGAVAVRPVPWLALGGGISVLPNVRGSVAVDFTSGALGNDLRVDVDLGVSGVAGIVVWPIDGLRLGFSWRGSNATRVEVPTSVKVSDKLATIRLDVLATEFSTPHEFSFGASYAFARGPVITADLTYYLFRRFQLAAPSVYLYDAQGEVSKSSVPAATGMRDAVEARMGLEWSLDDHVTIRSGYRFFRSPFPEQTGETNLMDGDRHAVSIGGAASFGVRDATLSLSGFLAVAKVVSNTSEKLVFDPANPGYPRISGGGWLLSFGASFSVDY